MKKLIISLMLVNLLAIGTVSAAPQNGIESQNVAVGQVGVVDVTKVMSESRQVKACQEEFNGKGKEVIQQLEEEKANLTPEEFVQRQKEVYSQFLVVKQEMEAKVQMKVKNAVEKVAKEKNLTMILYKESIAFGGIDITMEVINKLE